MLDIRKNQEYAIYESVIRRSDIETAKEIVYGKDGLAKGEDNANWVKSTMCRLENTYDQETIKQIRMDCQCGYAMDEKLAFVKELASTASNLAEFVSSEKAKSAGLFYCKRQVLSSKKWHLFFDVFWQIKSSTFAYITPTASMGFVF